MVQRPLGDPRALGDQVVATSSGTKLQAVLNAGAHTVVDGGDGVVGQVGDAAPDGIDTSSTSSPGDLVATGSPSTSGVSTCTTSTWSAPRCTRPPTSSCSCCWREESVQPVVSARLALEQAAEAQQELARRAHVGKIVRLP